MSLTYVALRRMKVGDEIRVPGDPVPEAEGWRNRHAWINTGHIAPVEKSSLDNKVRIDDTDVEDKVSSESSAGGAGREDSPSGGDKREVDNDDLTVAEIKKKVESGELDPNKAFEDESSREKPRSTLIDWLMNYDPDKE